MHFIKNYPKWPGWLHGFTKKGCTRCGYIKGRIWFIDKEASHMIGWCENQRGTLVCLYDCWPLGFCWVCPISSQLIQHKKKKKKKFCLFFLPQSSIYGYFWLPCATVSCSLTHLCQRARHGSLMTLWQSFTRSSLSLKRLTSLFDWNEVNAQYSLSFSHWVVSAVITVLAREAAGPEKPAGKGGMLWPLVLH